MCGRTSVRTTRYDVEHQTPGEGVSQISGANSQCQLLLLDQLTILRAALFRYNPPRDFTDKFLHERLFEFMPDSLSMPIAPTRKFWMHVLEAKINATIRNEGDMIG